MTAQARFGEDDMAHFALRTNGPYGTRQEAQAASHALGVEWVDHETAAAFAGFVAALSEPVTDFAAAWSAWTLVPA